VAHASWLTPRSVPASDTASNSKALAEVSPACGD
jgi:hypothetical protein